MTDGELVGFDLTGGYYDGKNTSRLCFMAYFDYVRREKFFFATAFSSNVIEEHHFFRLSL